MAPHPPHRLLPSLLVLTAALAPASALAGSNTYTSKISEVDACNQAQYLMPEKAVVTGFRVRSKTTKDGNSFVCKVRWSEKSKTAPTDQPILFPGQINVPLISL
jgi:hypothetical protein